VFFFSSLILFIKYIVLPNGSTSISEGLITINFFLYLTGNF